MPNGADRKEWAQNEGKVYLGHMKVRTVKEDASYQDSGMSKKHGFKCALLDIWS